MRSIFLALVLTSAAAAEPVIVSINPSSGPVTGGTLVTISGHGFTNTCQPAPACLPIRPMLLFGGVEGTIQSEDDSTIRVITPPHLPGTWSVQRVQSGAVARVEQGFTFTG